MPRVLALTSNPDDQTWLRLDREIREIRRRLAAAQASTFEFIVEPAAEAQYLLQLLQRHDPDILHFSGHGSPDGLLLENIAGGGQAISAKAIEGVFRTLKSKTKCVLLNSCYSEVQAKAISKSIDCVIGMSASVLDSAAISFAVGFYEALAFGRDVKTAYELGRHQVAILGIPDSDVPRLIPRKGTKPEKLNFSPRPQLFAEFLVDRSGSPRQHKGHYDVRLYLKNVPNDTISVVYQLDDSFEDPWNEVTVADAEDFGDVITTFADFEIRATLWSRNGGDGYRCRLADALRRRYGTNPRGEVGKALKALISAEQ